MFMPVSNVVYKTILKVDYGYLVIFVSAAGFISFILFIVHAIAFASNSSTLCGK